MVTNTYDGSGRVAQQQDGGGNLTSFEYTVDSSGTRTKITPPSGNYVWHYYDLAYNLTQVIDGEGHQAQFTSDSQGRWSGPWTKAVPPGRSFMMPEEIRLWPWTDRGYGPIRF